MKKIFTLALSLLIGATAFGQDQYDALMMAGEQFEGSARTMAMGGAFTALGGDLGAISINPASSGVFRHSQVSVTPSLDFSNSSSTYLGTRVNGSSTSFTMPNTGGVVSFDTGNSTGLLNFNFSFALNRKANFNSITKVAGSTSSSSYVASKAAELAHSGFTYDQIDLDITSNPFNNISDGLWPHILMYNAYVLDLDAYKPLDDAAYIPNTYTRGAFGRMEIPTELNQDLYRKTRGGIDEFSINFGGNVSDQLFFGVNLNIQDVHYIIEESMSEYTNNPGKFDTGFNEVVCNYWRQTAGVGVNAKFGLIYVSPFGLRLGATFTTPTSYRLTDTWDYTVNSYFNGSNSYYQNSHRESPSGVSNWSTKAPLRFSLGAAYVFGNVGILSFDYERVDYSTLWNGFRASNIFRAGAEARIANFVSLRAGYASYGSATADMSDTRFVSGGLGFNINSAFTIDVAYRQSLKTTETFTLYNDYSDDYAGNVSAPVGSLDRSGGKFSVTLNWKF